MSNTFSCHKDSKTAMKKTVPDFKTCIFFLGKFGFYPVIFSSLILAPAPEQILLYKVREWLGVEM